MTPAIFPFPKAMDRLEETPAFRFLFFCFTGIFILFFSEQKNPGS
jgi:hypothetical protein